VRTGSVDTARLFKEFSPQAGDLDAGRRDVRDGIHWLGRQGFLRSPDATDARAPLPYLVSLVRALAAASLSTAFSVWSQCMVLEYLTLSEPTSETEPLLEALRSGRVMGATALAPAIPAVGDSAPLPVSAELSGGGYLLKGTIGWASNLFDSAVVVTPADTAEGRIVAVFRLASPGVQVAAPAPLLALNGTGSSSVTLDGVRVAEAAVLSWDLPGFLAACRPTMLLLQTALAVGVTDACLAAIGADSRVRPHCPELDGRHQRVAATLSGYAEAPGSAGPGGLAQLRVDAMSVAHAAAGLEMAAGGGKAFQAGSASSRRVREAAFLPVQAPTLEHLHREIARTASA
jgi:alkylation response protein AidB-like acyl-CoA dehydrogenase